MPVALAGGKSGAVASAQDFLAAVGHEHEFAAQLVDKLVLVRMPVTLARPHSGSQSIEAHAELREAGRVAEPFPLSLPARLVVRRWIARSGVAGREVLVDLGHGRLLAFSERGRAIIH